ncbi:MAG TPA: AAA family ATPase, partial [Ktedonobacteraceae bacterium]|nr:AAA family ATPase [Ktedonobacteraceae bacterium]
RLGLGTVLDYISQQLPPGQTAVQSLLNSTGKECLLTSYPEYDRGYKRRQLLQTLLLNQSDFLSNRLQNFVGRQTELATLHQLIDENLPTGGYIIITGQAGQGKSSLIVKLIEDYGRENVAFHFIPLNPGPDHQVGLLRHLMARLILKHELSDLYVASESRSALRDYFPRVLDEIAAKGKQEVIFIDGLDQLEEDVTGIRDLSFLPTRPPAGIVFVLGTRPNDTLSPLELLKPHIQYQLPNLSRSDFDLILAHRHVRLRKELADQFYRMMQENALYLDLAARELQVARTLSPEQLIQRVVENPDNLFSVSIDRLKRHKREWQALLKPILGILMVAQEPLSLRQIRHILQIQHPQLDEEQVRDGIARLGGLVVQNGEGKYSLYHLKFREFLCQHETMPTKSYVFASDEEEHWHAILAAWCEQGDLASIWQEIGHNQSEQGRRLYARWHYITHLFQARVWDKLLAVLDEGQYGHSKIQFDPSMRFYTRDLALGQQVAAWEGRSLNESLDYLPRLWRYTLLRSSLISRADSYPPEAFRLMMVLGQEEKALGLAELLTREEDKVAALLQIAPFIFAQAGRQQEAMQLFLRIEQIAPQIQKSDLHIRALRMLATALGEAGCWIEAEQVVMQIAVSEQQIWALSTLGEALAKTELRSEAERVWQVAEQMIGQLDKDEQRSWSQRGLGVVMAKSGYLKESEQVASQIEKSYQKAWALSALAEAYLDIGQVEEFERVWQAIEGLIPQIEKESQKTAVLRGLAELLAKAERWTVAELKWKETERLIQQVGAIYQKVVALYALGESLLKSGYKDEAARIWEDAHSIVPGIMQKDQKPRVQRVMSIALAKAERWDEAAKVAAQIVVFEEKIKALQSLSASLTKASRWKEAEQTISWIEQQPERIQALSALGVALAEAGQQEEAQRIWSEAERLISQTGKSDRNTWILQALGESLVQAGHREDAEQLWSEAERLIQEMEPDHLRAYALSTLSEILARTACYNQARRIISQIEDSYQKSRALRALSESLAHAGSYEEAESVIYWIEKSDQKARAWQTLGEVLAQSRRNEEAEHAWQETERIIAQIEKSYQRNWYLSRLANALIVAGARKEAERIAQVLERMDLKAQTLQALGDSYMQTGEREEAQRIWKEAEHVMFQIRDGYQQAEALRSLGESLARSGFREEAERVWGEVERVIQQNGTTYQKAESLRVLGESWLEIANREKAEMLWSEAGSMIQQIGIGYQKANALTDLGALMAKLERWQEAEQAWTEAEQVLQQGEAIIKKSRALHGLGKALMNVKHWQAAERVILQIEDVEQKATALRELSEALVQTGNLPEAVNLLRRTWLLTQTRDEALLLLPLAFPFIPLHPALGHEFCIAIEETNRFLMLSNLQVGIHAESVQSKTV